MKKLATLLGLMCVLVVQRVSAEVYRHPGTGIELPDSLGGYQRGRVSPYGQGTDEPGVSAAFHGPDAVVTLYFRTIPPGSKKTVGDFLRESLEAIQILKQFSDVKTVEMDPRREPPEWRSAAITAKVDQQPVVSFISCAIKSDHLIKIRATTGKARNDELEVFLRKIREIIDAAKKN